MLQLSLEIQAVSHLLFLVRLGCCNSSFTSVLKVATTQYHMHWVILIEFWYFEFVAVFNIIFFFLLFQHSITVTQAGSQIEVLKW